MRLRILFGGLLMVLSAVPLFVFPGSDKRPQEVTVRGRALCVNGTRQPEPCSSSAEQFVLQTSEGKIYRFLKEDPSTAILTDPRVRERELQVSARRRPEDHLEIIKVYSVRQDRIFDLYYFCEVCNITAYAPGLCPCCRREMEFRETPVEKS
ncbi:MAG TPA: hypothetical protein VGK99_15835 [Acidobacteriota bacterium]|jgi:hypothetical protein